MIPATLQPYKPCPMPSAHFSISTTDLNHLMKDFPVWSGLGHYLPKDGKQLLESVVSLWHHVLNDRHQQAGKTLAIQHQLNDLLQGCRFISDNSITCNGGRGSHVMSHCTEEKLQGIVQETEESLCPRL